MKRHARSAAAATLMSQWKIDGPHVYRHSFVPTHRWPFFLFFSPLLSGNRLLEPAQSVASVFQRGSVMQNLAKQKHADLHPSTCLFHLQQNVCIPWLCAPPKMLGSYHCTKKKKEHITLRQISMNLSDLNLPSQEIAIFDISQWCECFLCFTCADFCNPWGHQGFLSTSSWRSQLGDWKFWLVWLMESTVKAGVLTLSGWFHQQEGRSSSDSGAFLCRVCMCCVPDNSLSWSSFSHGPKTSNDWHVKTKRNWHKLLYH